MTMDGLQCKIDTIAANHKPDSLKTQQPADTAQKNEQ
jgi:hypothetical protein